MQKYKTQVIQANLGTFTCIPAYSHIQAYSGKCRTLCNCGIFRSPVYSEPLAYSEPGQTSAMERFAKIVNDYNCFRKL